MASTKKIRREIRKEFFGEEDEGSASQKISAFLKQLLHEDDDNSKILTFQPSVDITERSKALIEKGPEVHLPESQVPMYDLGAG